MQTKFLFLILMFLPLFGLSQCVQVDSVYTTAEVKELENRNTLFGVKTITEEILQETGYSLCQGESVTINLTYIGLPENTFRIGGFAINNKITEVRVTISIGGNLYSGSGSFKTQAKAMLLELESGIPFKQTTLSIAIKMAIYDALK